MSSRLVTDVVRRASIQGVLLASILAVCAWYWFSWVPETSVDAVQGFLVGIIQTQASIWTIAVSFSLLFVQISVDSYSLRAARLLVENHAFLQMTGFYVFSLALNSLTSLVVSATPWFLPYIIGAIGVCTFIYGLYALAMYVMHVVYWMTPGAIVRELQGKISHEDIQQEALVVTRHEGVLRSVNFRPPICMPTDITTQARVGPDLRLLIDIAKRMVLRSDHVAIKDAVDAITDLRLRPHFEEPLSQELTQIEILNSSAVMAYLSGALMEVWSTAIQATDRITAALLISAMEQLIGDDVLAGSVVNTDVLDAAVRNRLFEGTGQLHWSDLRHQVICLITDRIRDYTLDAIEPKDAQALQPAVWHLLCLLDDLGESLLLEQHCDLPAEKSVFTAISLLGRYGARVGSADITTRVSQYLQYRASKLSKTYPDVDNMVMADLVRDMACLWIAGHPLTSSDSGGFYSMLEIGAEQVVGAYNDAIGKDSPIFPSGANFRYLDALEAIAQACIASAQWHRLEYTLKVMDHLVTDAEQTPGYLVHCLYSVLLSALDSLQAEPVQKWLSAVTEFLDHMKTGLPYDARQWLLEAATEASSRGTMLPDSDLSKPMQTLIDWLNSVIAKSPSLES